MMISPSAGVVSSALDTASDTESTTSIRSAGNPSSTAAFAIPGALGVQEGGFVVLGSVFGFGPDLSIALSLTKRLRELCLGLPGLIAWQLGTASGAARARAER